MDIAHIVLSGIVIALGGAMIGKMVTSKELKEKLEKVEKKLELRVSEFTPLPLCSARHDALDKLLEEKFKNLGDKLDTLLSKIDKMNRK